MAVTMSATAELQAVSEWVKVGLPKQATETFTASTVFMKQLTVLAVSQIAYLREAFHGENFKAEKFGGVGVYILKGKCKDKSAQFLVESLNKAFEAIKKKYLQKLAVCFYDKEYNVENLVEYHMFEYSYNEEGVSVGVSSSRVPSKYTFNCVSSEVRKMVRSLIVYCQSMQNPLPPQVEISLRFYYTPDAPNGYQAPGCIAPTELQDPLEWASESGCFEALKQGTAETRFHSLCASSAIRLETDNLSRQPEPSQNLPVMTPDSTGSFNNRSERSVQVLCLCDRKDKNDTMLYCNACGTVQHAACAGWLPGAPTPSAYRCERCAPAAEHNRLDHLKMKSICLLRRVIVWSTGRKTMHGPEVRAHLDGLSEKNLSKLFEALDGFGVLEPALEQRDFLSHRKINPLKMEKLIGSFFKKAENKGLAHLLQRESLPSASSSPADPFTNLLPSLQNITLDETQTRGKIIEPLQTVSAKADATLKQYNEALFSNEPMEDQLPLSGNHNPVPDVEMIGKRTGKRKNAGIQCQRVGVRNKKAKLARKD